MVMTRELSHDARPRFETNSNSGLRFSIVDAKLQLMPILKTHTSMLYCPQVSMRLIRDRHVTKFIHPRSKIKENDNKILPRRVQGRSQHSKGVSKSVIEQSDKNTIHHLPSFNPSIHPFIHSILSPISGISIAAKNPFVFQHKTSKMKRKVSSLCVPPPELPWESSLFLSMKRS